MQIEQKRAVIYCRVSTKEQVEEGNSLTTQEKACKEFALNQGIEIAEVFIEQGESAKTTERTELQRMIAYCSTRKNQVHFVIAYKIDRIARNSDDYSQIRILLKRLGVEIKSTSEHFENTPAGRFMENMLANVAQFDNDVRTERSIGGMREATREGRYVWTAPIGYLNQRIAGKSTIAPDVMAPLVFTTFLEIAKNIKPLDEIRIEMGKDGPANKGGKIISSSYFYTLIRNPLYTGVIHKFGETHKGSFQPIVSEELFNQVQRVIRYRSRRTIQYRMDNPDFPLRRFIIHKDSGRGLTGHWAKGRSKKFPYYRFHEPKINYKNLHIEAAFKQLLNSYELQEKHLKYLRKAFSNTLGKKVKDGQTELLRLEKHMAELKIKRNVLIKKNLEGVIGNSVLREQLDPIKINLRNSYAELLQLSNSEKIDFSTALETVSDFLINPFDSWQKAPFATQLKLQWFYFPKGVMFDGIDCQTTE